MLSIDAHEGSNLSKNSNISNKTIMIVVAFEGYRGLMKGNANREQSCSQRNVHRIERYRSVEVEDSQSNHWHDLI